MQLCSGSNVVKETYSNEKNLAKLHVEGLNSQTMEEKMDVELRDGSVSINNSTARCSRSSQGWMPPRDVQDRRVGELVAQSEGPPAFKQKKWQHVGITKNAAECTRAVESVLADIKTHAMSFISGWGASIAVLVMPPALTKAPWLKCRGWGVTKLVRVFLVALLFLSVSLVGATTGDFEAQAYLKAPNAESSDRFDKVAVSGDTIVVGAYYEASSQTTITNGATASTNNSAYRAGAAYVFSRTGTTWAAQAYLKAPNAGSDDYFGWAVAVSGDTIVVGAYLEDSSLTTITNGGTASTNNLASEAGAAYVFSRTGTTRAAQA